MWYPPMRHNLFNPCCHFVYGDTAMWLKCTQHPKNAIFMQHFAMSTTPDAWYSSSSETEYMREKKFIHMCHPLTVSFLNIWSLLATFKILFLMFFVCRVTSFIFMKAVLLFSSEYCCRCTYTCQLPCIFLHCHTLWIFLTNIVISNSV